MGCKGVTGRILPSSPSPSSGDESDDSDSSQKSPSNSSSDTSNSGDDSEPSPDVSAIGVKRKRDGVSRKGKHGDDDTKEEAEEVEVLSHAAQRKQRKKLRRGDANGEEGSPIKVTGSKSSANASSTKRQNSVWVGNLSFKTTKDQLQQFFSSAGPVTRINMPTKNVVGRGEGMRGQNRGFAYVDFETPEAKALAISLSEGHLDGRRLLIKDGGDFTGRPATTEQNTADADQGAKTGLTKTARKILSSQKQPAGPTLFMGNLAFETTEEDIRTMIEAHEAWGDRKAAKRAKVDIEEDGVKAGPNEEKARKLKKIRMGTFEDTGKCKGFAFLDFITPQDATNALTNPRNYMLKGRKLVLEFASPDAVRRGGNGPRPPKTDSGKKDIESRRKDSLGEGHTQRRGPHPSRDTDSAPQEGKGHSEKREKDVVGDSEAQERPHKRARDGKDSSHHRRPKPGAALALAQREKIAIVPSEGKKIKF